MVLVSFRFNRTYSECFKNVGLHLKRTVWWLSTGCTITLSEWFYTVCEKQRNGNKTTTVINVSSQPSFPKRLNLLRRIQAHRQTCKHGGERMLGGWVSDGEGSIKSPSPAPLNRLLDQYWYLYSNHSCSPWVDFDICLIIKPKKPYKPIIIII